MQQPNVVISPKEQGEYNALRAQVAIHQDAPEKALELAELALSQIDSTMYLSRIAATSVIGEVNHVLGNLNRALPMMQQTEKLARQYQAYHQALWAILQQSEILVAQGNIQAAYETQDNAFKMIKEHHFQQTPLHLFLLNIRAQVLWYWNRLDEAQECTYKGLEILNSHKKSEHLHNYSMLTRIAIAQGEIDKANEFVEHITLQLKQSTYHVEWTASASLALILFWQARGDLNAIQQWLKTTIRPQTACNRFTQLQWRNIARAQITLKQYSQAKETLLFLRQHAKKSYLLTDISCNLIIEALLAIEQDDEQAAQQHLKQALQLTRQTGMLGNFLIAGRKMDQILQKLIQSNQLEDLERHRVQQLLRHISTTKRHNSIHLNKALIDTLIKHPSIPELVRTNPLTQREWQVLRLIYSGFNNEHIAQELNVASTTIKTHIRNLYQKLNITNRQEAIKTTENLLGVIGNETIF